MFVALALSALPALAPAGPPASSASLWVAPQDGSLQELLASARKKRAAAFARLAPRIQSLIDRLEALGRPRPENQITALRSELDGFGPPAAGLLLPHVDPGASPKRAQLFRAGEVRDALIRMGTGELTQALDTMLSSATLHGRVNAIALLGASSDQKRAGKVLRELFPSTTNELLQKSMVAALVRLGGAANLDLALKGLVEREDDYVRAAVEACAAAERTEAASAIATLLEKPEKVQPILLPLTEYYAACPGALNTETLVGLFRLAGSKQLPNDERITLLTAITHWDFEIEAPARKELEQLAESPVASLREGALILLANLGDREAKRNVLRAYDYAVAANPRFASVQEKRGDILVRLGDHDDAARDFKKAVDLLDRQGRFVAKELRVKLARAFAVTGKAKLAYDALKAANLSPSWLRGLAADPDFAVVLEHSRYRKIFD